MASQKVLECGKALASKNWRITFVESATAGKMSYEFSTVPESGKILIGGLVCYDACMKKEILAIPHHLIETFTPESAEVTQAMAKSFSKYTRADICVAITGLTTSGGSETPEKPVGTIFVHIIFPHNHISRRFQFDGNPEQIVNQAIEAVAEEIIFESEKS